MAVTEHIHRIVSECLANGQSISLPELGVLFVQRTPAKREETAQGATWSPPQKQLGFWNGPSSAADVELGAIIEQTHKMDRADANLKAKGLCATMKVDLEAHGRVDFGHICTFVSDEAGVRVETNEHFSSVLNIQNVGLRTHHLEKPSATTGTPETSETLSEEKKGELEVPKDASIRYAPVGTHSKPQNIETLAPESGPETPIHTELSSTDDLASQEIESVSETHEPATDSVDLSDVTEDVRTGTDSQDDLTRAIAAATTVSKGLPAATQPPPSKRLSPREIRNQRTSSGRTSLIIAAMLALIVVVVLVVRQLPGPDNPASLVTNEEPVLTIEKDSAASDPESSDSLTAAATITGTGTATETATASDSPVAEQTASATLTSFEPILRSTEGYTLVVGSTMNPTLAAQALKEYASLGMRTGILTDESDEVVRYRMAVGVFSSGARADSARKATPDKLPQGTWVFRIR